MTPPSVDTRWLGVIAIVTTFDSSIEDALDVEDARDALLQAERIGTVPWERVKADQGL